MGQGDELTDLGERSESIVLIRFQEGHDTVSGLGQVSQERCGHPFTIHNEVCACCFPTRLLIASQYLRQAYCQMLVAARGGSQTRMPLLIMQKRQRPPSQNFASASDQSARDQAVGIDGFAVPIDVKTRSSFLSRILETLFPQMGRPGAKGGSQRFRPIGFGKLAEKPLGMAIPVGSMPSCHHC